MKLRLLSIMMFMLFVSPALARTVTDGVGRTLEIPDRVEHVICSGAGCLRLLTYLQAQDRIVGVDDIEIRERQRDARPYALANPQFKTMNIFGEFRGKDHPEQILSLEPQPQVIFKTFAEMGYSPEELQRKTGIPVVVLPYGNLTDQRHHLYASLRIMALIIDCEERAEEVIRFVEDTIDDLAKRTVDIAKEDRPEVYLGGVAFKGPHGFQSTEAAYPPFIFVGAKNLASDKTMAGVNTTTIAKEKIVVWDPAYLFLDLSTTGMGEGVGGLHELRSDPAYRTLSGVKENRVYGVLPYNAYASNYGSTLANSYYIGKLLYPRAFTDIDPVAKADEIFMSLVGARVFEKMNTMFDNLVFANIPVN